MAAVGVRDANEEELERVAAYNKLRSDFYENAESWKWHQMYKHGVESPEVKHLEKPFRPAPSDIIIE